MCGQLERIVTADSRRDSGTRRGDFKQSTSRLVPHKWITNLIQQLVSHPGLHRKRGYDLRYWSSIVCSRNQISCHQQKISCIIYWLFCRVTMVYGIEFYAFKSSWPREDLKRLNPQKMNTTHSDITFISVLCSKAQVYHRDILMMLDELSIIFKFLGLCYRMNSPVLLIIRYYVDLGKLHTALRDYWKQNSQRKSATRLYPTFHSGI